MTQPPIGEVRVPAPASLRSQLFRLGLGLGLAGLFLYLFLRDVELAELGRACLLAHPGYLGAALAAALASFVVRGRRWQYLLRPVQAVSFATSFDVMMIGYMVSVFVPGRPGDPVVRPLLLHRSDGIPPAGTLATVAIERLFDSIAVLVAFAVFVAFLAPAGMPGDLAQARTAGYSLLGFCLALVAGLFWFHLREAQGLALLERRLGILPERWRGRALAQARAFAGGLRLFADHRSALLALATTVLAWGLTALSMWLVAAGMGLAIRLQDSLLLIAMGALGIAIPTPGGAGSVAYLLEVGLGAIGAGERDVTKAAALLIWGLTPIPVTVLGLLSARRRRLRLGEIERTAVARAR